MINLETVKAVNLPDNTDTVTAVTGIYYGSGRNTKRLSKLQRLEYLE